MSNINIGVHGRFKIKTVDNSGKTINELPWQDNLITDYGLERAAVQNSVADFLGSYIAVGTDNSAPNVTQTNLDAGIAIEGPIGGSGDFHFYNNVTPFSDPPNIVPYASFIKTFTFDLGAVVGNVAEIGRTISNNLSSNTFTSRALIKDGSGNPTTLTITSEEQLIVNYELRVYKDIKTPETFSVSFGAGTMTGSILMCHHVQFDSGYSFSPSSVQLKNSGGLQSPITDTMITSNDENDVLVNPGSVLTSFNIGRSESSINNVRTVLFTFTPAQGNVTFNTMIFQFFGGLSPVWIFYFDTPITKTNLDILEMEVTITWSRYTP